MVAEVEEVFEFGIAQDRFHVGVFFQEIQKIAFAPPDGHGVALDECIGALARETLLRQRQQNPLRMDETAERVEFFFIFAG